MGRNASSSHFTFKKTEIIWPSLNFSKTLTKKHLSKNIPRLLYFSGICGKNTRICQIIKNVLLRALAWPEAFVIDKQNNYSLLTYPGCFSCTMEGGFRIYNVEPLSEKARVGESLITTMVIICFI